VPSTSLLWKDQQHGEANLGGKFLDLERIYETNSDEGESFSSVFPGCQGPLHYSRHKEVPLDSVLCALFHELSFKQSLSLAYMFNFQEESGILATKSAVKVQLDDSEWSRSFSLNSVGVNQVLSIDHSSRGMLEVGLKIKSAPGKLSKYTKVVRFTPRFIFVNRLPVNLKICQSIGFGDEFKEVEVSANFARAYHLPVVFADRKIFLQIDGPWKRSVSFDIDQIGIFTLEVKRKLDLASIQHINTRGTEEYAVHLPRGQIVGIAFETDWGEENIVVKAIQSGSIAAKQTDIRVGDVLIAVESKPVTGADFEMAMAAIKSKLVHSDCVIKLRTVEQKLQLLRESALHSSGKKLDLKKASFSTGDTLRSPSQPWIPFKSFTEVDTLALRVELRQIDSSVVISTSEFNKDLNTEYRIENQSICYRIHFRQKGIPGAPWATLNPGQSCSFIWEDPFKPHKLLVHIGDNILSPSDNRNALRFAENGEIGDKGRGDDSLGVYLSYTSGMTSDSAVVIHFDEIGFIETLSLHKNEGHLLATIKSEGPSKVLIVTPSLKKSEVLKELDFSSYFIYEQSRLIKDLEEKVDLLVEACVESEHSSRKQTNISKAIDHIFKDFIRKAQEIQSAYVFNSHNSPQPQSKNHSVTVNELQPPIEKSEYVSYKPFDRMFEAGIDRPNQILVEILEAREITPFVAGKSEDIYCKLYIINKEKSKLLK
jgi:hypothetical protein